MTNGSSQSASAHSAVWPGSAVGPVGVADGLGVASAALGAPMLLAPRRFLAAIGVRPDAKATATTLGVGVREFAATATILGMRHRRVGAWSRVAGDTMDLALLARAWRTRRTDTARLLGATGFVAAVLGADAAVAIALGRAEGTRVDEGSSSHGTGANHDTAGGPARVRTAITVQGSEEEIRRAFHEFAWSAFDPAKLEQRGEVRLVAAPGDRGVEVHIDHDPAVPAGAVGATALKLAGRSPDQKINDELRRFKALVETGVELVRSDKRPEGPSALRQIMQRPGQPVGAS
jgi:hypothetical protein